MIINGTLNKNYTFEADFTELLPEFEQDWVTSTAYAVKELVRSSAGGVYYCHTAHTSGSLTEPGVGANSSTVWALFLEDGAAGETGCANNIPSNAIVVGDTGLKTVKSSGRTLTDGVLGGGFSNAVFDAGTKSSGTFTPAASDGNMQKCVNGGAFTLAVPSTDTVIYLKITNNSSAGTITMSGYTKVFGSFTTTNGHKFEVAIRRMDGDSLATITRMQ